MHEVLINRLVKLAQEKLKKNVVSQTDHLDMTIAVDRDVKPQTEQTKTRSGELSCLVTNRIICNCLYDICVCFHFIGPDKEIF